MNRWSFGVYRRRVNGVSATVGGKEVKVDAQSAVRPPLLEQTLARPNHKPALPTCRTSHIGSGRASRSFRRCMVFLSRAFPERAFLILPGLAAIIIPRLQPTTPPLPAVLLLANRSPSAHTPGNILRETAEATLLPDRVLTAGRNMVSLSVVWAVYSYPQARQGKGPVSVMVSVSWGADRGQQALGGVCLLLFFFRLGEHLGFGSAFRHCPAVVRPRRPSPGSSGDI